VWLSLHLDLLRVSFLAHVCQKKEKKTKRKAIVFVALVLLLFSVFQEALILEQLTQEAIPRMSGSCSTTTWRTVAFQIQQRQ
jgi:hypothetical protein